MRISLYSPYIPQHFGGGEKYAFDVLTTLATRHQVSVALSHHIFSQTNITEVKQQYATFTASSLDDIEFVSSPLGTTASVWEKLNWTRQWDVLYYVTDGSLFWSLAKKNILHIQFPLKLNKSSLVEKTKLSNWQIKNTNSQFTKEVVEKSWPTKIDLVHHPLVELTTNGMPIQPQLERKENIILSVGRFFRQLHSKRQDVLVDIFKRLISTNPEFTGTWKLVLIGGVEDESYAQAVKQQAKSLPVEIYHNLTREELIEWYSRSSIYWHATGFGIDETQEPEKVEHFGISTAEAMLAGCAPIVLGKGGQKEVVGSSLTNWLWQDPTECVDKTLQLIKNKKIRQSVQTQGMAQARHFSRARFEEKLWQMIEH